jgi:hypothetical protein
LPSGNILGDVTVFRVVIRFITVLVFWPTKNYICGFLGKLEEDIVLVAVLAEALDHELTVSGFEYLTP